MSEANLMTEQITFKVPREIRQLMEDLCYEEVAGQKLKVTDISKWAREFFYRGMRQYLQERQLVEKYKNVIEVKEG